MLCPSDKKDDKPQKGRQMNKKLKFSLVCLLFIALTSGALAEANLTELVNEIRPAIVTIQTYDQNKKPLGQGTGFFININTLITNYHVLRGAHQAEIITHDGMKYPITRVIAENKKMDLIKLLVDIPRESVSHVNLGKSLPSIAENIVVIGSPFGLEQTVSEGIISSVRLIPKIGTLLQISAPISRGSSGSPVLNMKGEVVGIVRFFVLDGQNLNFAIPAGYIFDLQQSETLKTISEWNRQNVCRLYVPTEPEGARVRILNIKPNFFQGIVLEPGSYHIEVSASGYKMKKVWTKIGPGEDKILNIFLKKLPQLLTEDSDELLSIGNAYLEKGEYKKAIRAFKQAIRIRPDCADAHTYLAFVYVLLGHHYEAIVACKQALLIKPDCLEAQVILGGAYLNLGRYTEAIEAQKQAIRIKPDNATAHFGLGTAYLRSGNRSSALDQYKILKDLDKKLANELFNLIYE